MLSFFSATQASYLAFISRLKQQRLSEAKYKKIINKMTIRINERIKIQAKEGKNYLYLLTKDLNIVSDGAVNSDILGAVIGKLNNRGFEAFYDEGRLNIYWK